MSQSIYPVPANIKNAALVDNDKYNTLYKQSIDDPETFWASIGGRNAPVGEAFVEDASNIRLRELSLSYALSQASLTNSPFNSVKLSLVGRNLFFFSNEASIDPEVTFGTGLKQFLLTSN